MRYLNALIVLFLMVVAISGCKHDGTTPIAPTYPQGKPTGLDVVSGSHSATVSWNTVAGANGYYVYISENGISFNRVGNGLIQATSLQVFDLTNGKTYYFGVSAVGAGGWESSIAYPGGSPTAVEVIPNETGEEPPPNEGTPPKPPTSLQGIAKDAACEIKWNPSSSIDADFYRIYRRAFVGSFSTWPILVDSWYTTEYRDEDLENDLEYVYRITAIDTEDLESIPSNEVTLIPMNFPPEPLTGLSLFRNPGRIVLEWNVPAETDIAKYAIERVEGVDPSGAEILVRILIEKPTRTDPDNPHTDASELLKWWLDLPRDMVVFVDGTTTAGLVYKYRISAMDTHVPSQEGPPVEVVADGPAF